MIDGNVMRQIALSETMPVEDHSVPWIPSTWTKYVDVGAGGEPGFDRHVRDSLRAALAEVHAAVSPGDWRPWISRGAVVQLTRQSSPLSGYLAAIIRGCGTSHRNRMRMLRVFQANEDVLSRVTRFVDVAPTLSPADAWDAMNGDGGLTGLGPAFGTKVLYFSVLARRDGSSSPLPLIANVNVAAAVDSPVDESRDAYPRYCERAFEIATTLPTGERRPDRVELALFKLGRQQLREARRFGR